MELQAEAERRKRASILESEGQRQAVINVAEGSKQEVRCCYKYQLVACCSTVQGEDRACTASSGRRCLTWLRVGSRRCVLEWNDSKGRDSWCCGYFGLYCCMTGIDLLLFWILGRAVVCYSTVEGERGHRVCTANRAGSDQFSRGCVSMHRSAARMTTSRGTSHNCQTVKCNAGHPQL
jgi:hypothetical protein